MLSIKHSLKCCAIFFLAASCAHEEVPLKTGDVAPNFSLTGSDGRTYKLADYQGKQAVVLAWFPKAFTGG